MFKTQQANQRGCGQGRKSVNYVSLEQKKVLGEVMGSVKDTEGFCIYPERNEMPSKHSK